MLPWGRGRGCTRAEFSSVSPSPVAPYSGDQKTRRMRQPRAVGGSVRRAVGPSAARRRELLDPGMPQVWTRRQRVAGTRWRTRTGAPWRDVPERYGPWGRVYDLFRRRRRDGTWAQILTPLQAAPDAKGLITWGGRRRLHRPPGPPTSMPPV
ncbi:transposase [Streptomyces virginiae]|uniref:transposase n=1 Tax=Streptomyces virginiae TaxID=1961 RepID=UPI003655F0BE